MTEPTRRSTRQATRRSTRRSVRRSRQRVVGLTGGVASGKSTVSQLLVELGARIVDADALAREVVQPGKVAYREIVQSFGRDILARDGSIDRKKLGAAVFADLALRQRLDVITHPRIRRAARRAINTYFREGASVVIYEAALLVETGYFRELDGLIVVSLPESLQLERLMQRDGLDREQALRRVRSQLPLEEKLKMADFVIDNSGSLQNVRDQVQKIWSALQQG